SKSTFSTTSSWALIRITAHSGPWVIFTVKPNSASEYSEAISCSTGVESLHRRDHRADCYAPRAAGRPFSLSTTPVPLRKPRARHELQSRVSRKSGGFRLRLAAALRSGCDLLSAPLRPPLHFPRSPTA